MEVYNIPDQGLADMHLIHCTETDPQFTSQLRQLEAMYNEGAPEFFLDQGLYYPTTTSYGYISPGFESTGDWEDHYRIFGLDGQDIQYTGVANESLPYVYYAPSYGYEQSSYNPYNPYIPGAAIGVDGTIVAPQHFYALPSYENPVTSPSYVPMAVQSRPDTVANGRADPFFDSAFSVNQIDDSVPKHNFPSDFPKSLQNTAVDASRSSFVRLSEGGGANAGYGKQPLPSVTSSSFRSQASPQVIRAGGPQGTENGSSGKAPLGSGPLKTAFPSASGLSGFESKEKVRPKALYGRGPDNTRVGPNSPSEQNQVPRTNKAKNQLVVKARTTRAGNVDAEGNIVISLDQYNAVDFPIAYANAKFFVIKSYSEDDVHKSIKYNMWSSTPNGNKKLNSAYEDAQRTTAGDIRGCPIFLFFSVNASGQFCGVAEMVGPVDFDKDMDFWQQDKWSGSFPVRWHIVKDLPNPNFRHIILENNENKPVTNSRDTQEIPYKKGLEMLQIFKNYTLKTSLLDDFMYYENRQRIMQEERARLLIKSYENPYLVPLLDPPRKFQSLHDFPSVENANATKHNAAEPTILSRNNAATDGEPNRSVNSSPMRIGRAPLHTKVGNSTTVCESSKVSADPKPNTIDELNLSSLTINSQDPESECPVPTTDIPSTASGELVDVVTIGSMPVKVNGAESSGFLIVGKIPLDPRSLRRD